MKCYFPDNQVFYEATAFPDLSNGKPVTLNFLKNSNKMQIAITNYGGRIIGAWVPDKNGVPTDVVVGFNSIACYKNATEKYYGATIGRVANRIAASRFTLEGNVYHLTANDGENSLHGGKKGFHEVVWEAQVISDQCLRLHYLSKDHEEGFPGNLTVTVTFTLTQMNELIIDYLATTDKKTIVNLTNHAFFNLNGEGSGSVLNHELKINATFYTPIDASLIPLGNHESVVDTPFDFTEATTIGARINEANIQLKNGSGYDHNFVLNKPSSNSVTADPLTFAASLYSDQSGILMEIFTEEPGLQFYSGNFMKGENIFKSGVKDDFRTALALETQHFPDSPNQANFPSTVLNPGEQYKTRTVYKFSCLKEQ